MAFLTFRQSDNTVTEAQKTRKHVSLGVPLTMYHVDANFKAINDELVGLHEKYGLSVSAHDTQKSLADIFGTNNVNNITHTGFYRLGSTANVPGKIGESVIMHIQSATGGLKAITAFQLTAGIEGDNSQTLYYRTKQGENSWNPWQKYSGNQQAKQLAELSAEIAKCVQKSGDTITGALTIQAPSTFTGNNNIISEIATRPGDGMIPTLRSQDGFTFYGVGGPTIPTRLGFTGIIQDTTSFSGVALQAINPSNKTIDETAEIRVGWKMLTDYTGYRPYTYAPTPLDSGNLNAIATTGWVNTQIDAKIDASIDHGNFDSTGGIITGDVLIEGELTVNKEVSAGRGWFNDEVVVVNGPTAVSLPIAKGQFPTATRGAESNGFLVIDSSHEAKVKNAAARFWGSVDSVGAATAEVAAVKWVTTARDEDAVKAAISVTISNDGKKITTAAPVPPANDNGKQIATTGWSSALIDKKITAALKQYEIDHPYDMGEL